MGGHLGYDRSGGENTSSNSGTYINLAKLAEQKNIASYISGTIVNQYGGILKSYILERGNGYNNSQGHYETRTIQKWTECGNAFILFYKPGRTIEDREGKKRKVTGYVVWHYELFQ